MSFGEYEGTEDCPVPNVVRAILRLGERSGASEGEVFEALSTALPTLTGAAVVELVRGTTTPRIPDGKLNNLTLESLCKKPKSSSKT